MFCSRHGLRTLSPSGREGAHADVCVFDPDEVAPGSIRRVQDFPAGADRLTADSPTGIRLDIDVEDYSSPDGEMPVDPSILDGADGYSPLTPILVNLGLDVHPDQLSLHGDQAGTVEAGAENGGHGLGPGIATFLGLFVAEFYWAWQFGFTGILPVLCIVSVLIYWAMEFVMWRATRRCSSTRDVT